MILNLILSTIDNILHSKTHIQEATGIVVGAVCAVVGAVTGIASAINGGKAQKDALQMQYNQGQLQLRNEKELSEAQQKIDNKNTKLKIITDSVANIRSSQTQAVISQTIASRQLAKDSEKRNVVIASVGGGIILIGALIVLKKTS
jgi:hypothetical protein